MGCGIGGPPMGVPIGEGDIGIGPGPGPGPCPVARGPAGGMPGIPGEGRTPGMPGVIGDGIGLPRTGACPGSAIIVFIIATSPPPFGAADSSAPQPRQNL